MLRCRGYVLLAEVLLGLSLVLIALLTVFHLFISSDSLVSVADQTAQATHLARRILEEELTRPYLDVQSFVASETVPHGARRGAELRTDFEYQVEVTEPDPAKKVKRVTVRVSWGLKPRHQVSLLGSKGEQW